MSAGKCIDTELSKGVSYSPSVFYIWSINKVIRTNHYFASNMRLTDGQPRDKS